MSYRKLIARASQVALVACLGVAGSSWAGSTTQNVTVTTHVIDNCIITLPVNLAFAAYDPLSSTLLTTNGSITLTCTKGSNGVTVGVGNGGNFLVKRRMAGAIGGDFLTYDLFQPDVVGAGGVITGTAFGPGTFAVGAASFATGSTPVLVKIFGSIPINQDVTGQSGAGNTYTDTVVATVTF